LGRTLQAAARAALLLGTLTWAAAGAEVNIDELLNQAQAADLRGERTNALALVSQAIAAAPTNAQCYYVRGRLHASHGDHAQALADLDRVLQLEPRAAEVYQFRGFEQMRLGRFTEAIADFDQFLRYAPRGQPFHWQRGVACYFAGRFAEARKQFEAHQLVNSNDVENAAWHFAAVARAEGPEAARGALLRGLKDRRLPMMQIYGLLQGKLKPDDVLASARAGRPLPQELKQRLFFAHYYIGLYYEAVGQQGLAREHLRAAAEHAPPTFMGDVARVHASRVRTNTP
jgi:lipoprotein NlpI